MSTQSPSLVFSQAVKAPVSEVYRAFTNSTALREWLCDAGQAAPHRGGRLYLAWNNGYYACGEFNQLEPNQEIAFTYWGRGEPAITQVQVSLTPADGGTLLTLSHSGIGNRGKWAKGRKAIERGWKVGLENLVSVLENGQDLRIVLRPMLGVNIGEFNAERAAQLGVPVTQGVRLDGVVVGMGAQISGLQKDDVMVGVGGQPIDNYPALVAVLQGRRAGERVEVVYYRGSEKRSTLMTLSRRQIPPIPPTAVELAQALTRTYSEQDDELAKCFVGVSEQEASHHPTAGEWNAKEVLAHLIHGERDNHSWLNDLLFSQERVADGFGDNAPARIRATAAAYPTVADLLTELKRNKSETIATVAGLPADFVAHKGSYWRLAFNLLDSSTHLREHIDQIRGAIASARK